MRTNIRLIAVALAIAFATGGCAAARVGSAISDLEPGCCSCWNRVESPTYPASGVEDCKDAQAAPDEKRCAAELGVRRPRLWWYDDIRTAHRACMADRGWVRDNYLLITH